MNSDYRQVQHYLAHFGIKGQSWYTRHFQSYETAPTRSGKVGQEVGEAAAHSRRISKEERKELLKEKEIKRANAVIDMQVKADIEKSKKLVNSTRENYKKRTGKSMEDDNKELSDRYEKYLNQKEKYYTKAGEAKKKDAAKQITEKYNRHISNIKLNMIDRELSNSDDYLSKMAKRYSNNTLHDGSFVLYKQKW